MATHAVLRLDGVDQPHAQVWFPLAEYAADSRLVRHANLSRPVTHLYPGSLCKNREGWGPFSPFRDLDLTPCFEDAVLVVAPILVFAFAAAIRLARLSRRDKIALPASSQRLLVAKLSILFCLIIVAALDVSLSFELSRGGVFNDGHFWTTVVTFLGFGVAAVLHYREHSRPNLRSPSASSILLLFWLAYIVGSLVRLRTSLSIPTPLRKRWASFALQVAELGLAVLVFAIECYGPGDLTKRPRKKPLAGRRTNGYGAIPNATSEDEEDGTSSDDEEDEKPCPITRANIFSRITFSWMNPLMKLGRSKFVTEDDLWSLPPGEDTEELRERLGKEWAKEQAKAKKKNGRYQPKLWMALAKAFGGPYFLAGLFKACQDSLAFVQPQLLRRLLTFVESYRTPNPERPLHGYVVAISIFVVALAQTAFLHQYFHLAFLTGQKIRAALVGTIFRKSLRLSAEERNKRATGDIVNLMSVDATRLQDLCAYGHIAWSGLFQMTLAFVSLYRLLGWQAFVGVAIMFVSLPINTAVANYQKKLQQEQMKNKDARTRLMNEILTNIKSIKLFGWENSFTAKLLRVRNDQELVMLRKMGIVSSCANFLWTVIPFFVSFATFATFVFTSDVPLTSDIIFPAIALFSLLQFPLAMFANVISSIIEASVAATRLSDFLDARELDAQARLVVHPTHVMSPSIAGSLAPSLLPSPVASGASTPLREEANGQGEEVVTIRNGEFKWAANQPTPTLQDINLSVRKGELLAVLGRVGDGKTSLLSAILGEMVRVEGEVVVRGRIAYFSQSPWVLGASIKDNILFGHKYDERFYKKVLFACALEPDLAILPDGDRTEVGEKGVSLSGGQKARVALARAVYSRADIYLLDDPLAAVDAHVGAHIFRHVIGPRGLLRSKARILTTNSVSILSKVDQIIYIRRGIILDERGTYRDVMAMNGEVARLIYNLGRQAAVDNEGEYEDTDATTIVDDEDRTTIPADYVDEAAAGTNKKERRLSTTNMHTATRLSIGAAKREMLRKMRESTRPKEKSEQGRVQREVYLKYIEACSKIGVIFYLLCVALTQAASIGANVVLKFWGQRNAQTGGDPRDIKFYLPLYFSLGFGSSLLMVITSILLYVVIVVKSARRIHDTVFKAVLRAPLQYFESTPVGQILNLFSRDIYTVDEVLARVFSGFFRTMAIVSGVLAIIVISTPLFLLAVIPLVFAYRMILTYYLRTSRELKRLDAVSRAPVFSWFQESLGGLSSIRAYEQEGRFIAISDARVDRNQQAYFPAIACNRWLAVRVEFLGSCVIFLAALLSVFSLTHSGNIDAGLVGLMMSQALSTTQALNWLVRSASEVEQNIVSVERCISYANVEPEAPYELPDHSPPANWPDKGKVELVHYSTRYRADLDFVLKDIQAEFLPGERIGVVGRTGAGKSSLTLALFRIIEPAEGTIKIDNLDITNMGLRDLRTRLSIVPQDAQLWQGTLRENLDPTGSSGDAALWRALETAKLKDYFVSVEGGLDYQLSEAGSNLSSGQRQLVSIARALLRETKILVLDEATSAIDLETDEEIQKIVREQFKDRTTFTIAHRLNTILDYDRILVLSQGRVVELDKPDVLLSRKDSAFRSMALEAGIVKE